MSIWWKSILGHVTAAFMRQAYPDDVVSIYQSPWGAWTEGYFEGVSNYLVYCMDLIDLEFDTIMDQLDDAGVPRQRPCTQCVDFSDESEWGDYGVQYSYEPCCRRFPKYNNLSSFPFKNAQNLTCFVLNFWNSKYASLMTGNEEIDDLYFERYKREYLPQQVKA